MSRCLGMVCAGVLAAAAVGCTTFGPRQVVTGTVPEVSRRIEDGLSEAGIAVISKQLDGERRLAGQDRQSGKCFCIHMYGKKVGKVDKTLVSIEKDPGMDDTFLKMILGFATGPETDADNSTPHLPIRPGPGGGGRMPRPQQQL